MNAERFFNVVIFLLSFTIFYTLGTALHEVATADYSQMAKDLIEIRKHNSKGF